MTAFRASAQSADFTDPADPFWGVFVRSLVFVTVQADGVSSVTYETVDVNGEPTVAIAEDVQHLRTQRPHRAVRLRAEQLIAELPAGHAIGVDFSAEESVVFPAATIDWLRNNLAALRPQA